VSGIASAALKVAVAVAAHPHLGHVQIVEATAYSPCSSGTIMADGHRTYFGAVASNRLPMHTLIRVRRKVHGRRLFRVRDRGSARMQLDFFLPNCRDAVEFGRRRIAFQVQR
jgi:3D (Asp-Asp-Asp) domain-containing protein